MIYILISVLAGVTIVVARIINSNLASKIGLFQSTFYNFLTGLLFSSIILLFNRESLNISFTSVPIMAFLGGLIGVISISFSNYVAPKISAFYMALLIFVGQLFIGILIDYFTLNELSLGKVVGGLIVVIGLGFNLLVDKKELEVN
ncbi:DMT family transporter [Clostridium sp. SHJSY1]|uniref:DMT family transporter n=1 Tax=Clostridium sp. SHJSY1 TaxID=2942483 RepID=UPI0028748639|nr:DMT family transporter [Clostridium sp. SHJSY1]MDS0524623.1 DMT family transporter [Clostridium sp. SHJSY1]